VVAWMSVHPTSESRTALQLSGSAAEAAPAARRTAAAAGAARNLRYDIDFSPFFAAAIFRIPFPDTQVAKPTHLSETPFSGGFKRYDATMTPRPVPETTPAA
jgi:hypothetical protein